MRIDKHTTKKAIVNKFKLKELSTVFEPAHEGALIALYKSKLESEEPPMKKSATPGATKDTNAPAVTDDPNTGTKAPEAEVDAEALKKAKQEADDALKATVAAELKKAKEAYEGEITKLKTALSKAVSGDEDDPVVYTDKEGVQFRKSAGTQAVEQAKQMDSMRVELQKMRDSQEQLKLEKQAGEQLADLTGDVVTKVAFLKALGTISDETQRQKVLEMVKARKPMEGVSGAPNPEADVANEEIFETKVQALMKSKGLDYVHAYNELLDDPDARKLIGIS